MLVRQIIIFGVLGCFIKPCHNVPLSGETLSLIDNVQRTNEGGRSECAEKDNLRYLQVLPGGGWDNIANTERGLILEREQYILCRTSIDGVFILPDDMILEPKRSSSIQLSSQVFESSASYKSVTAGSINSAVDMGISFFSVNGDFSAEKEHQREIEGSQKGLIVQSQLRHKRYTVRAMPDAKLHPKFLSRLYDIAASLYLRNISLSTLIKFDEADYSTHHSWSGEDMLHLEQVLYASHQADLIVRDFGTHCITSVDAGGILVKTDKLDEKSAKTSESDRLKLAASASVSFGNLLKIDAKSSIQLDEDKKSEYQSHVTNSRIESYGGPIFRAQSMNLSEWERDLDNQLVVIDRSGVPIYDLITTNALPEIESKLHILIVRVVQSAVERYYSANAIVGCMDPSSKAFDADANVASKDCSTGIAQSNVSLPLGGVYQKCIGPQTLCENVDVKNTLTGDHTCPTGYISVQLLPTQVRSCVNKCNGNKCHQECAVTELFWCALDPTNPGIADLSDNTGLVFGGLYTDKEVNPITNSYNCPEFTWSLSIGRIMRICLSSDRELTSERSLPFGGFYSCRFGNPLATALEPKSTSFSKSLLDTRKLQQNTSHSVLRSGNGLLDNPSVPTTQNEDYTGLFSSIWPRRCPQGYAAHVASMEDACEVNFCVPAHTMKKRKRHLRRPPFVFPAEFYMERGDGKPSANPVEIRGWFMDHSEVGPHQERRLVVPTDTSDESLDWKTKVIIALGTVTGILLLTVVGLGLSFFFYNRSRDYHLASQG